MKFNVYAMRDLKSGFLTPTVDQNDAMASRNFASSIQRSEGVLFTHKPNFSSVFQSLASLAQAKASEASAGESGSRDLS